jgi:hypothetical protein
MRLVAYRIGKARASGLFFYPYGKDVGRIADLEVGKRGKEPG